MRYDDPKERFVANLTGAQDAIYAYILSLLPNTDVARGRASGNEHRSVAQGGRVRRDEELRRLGLAASPRFQVKARRRDMQREKLIFNDELLDNLAADGRILRQAGRLRRPA